MSNGSLPACTRIPGTFASAATAPAAAAEMQCENNVRHPGASRHNVGGERDKRLTYD